MARRRPARRLARLLRRTAWMLGGLVLASVALVLALRWLDPPTSSFMLQHRVAQITATRPEPLHHQWRAIEYIAPAAALAVVASEDQLFPRHRGFDFASIRKAMDDRASGRRTRGASTISQQVAKNLFLWPGRSWIRKGLEAWFTLLIETAWPKRRILEVYLNVAEFGPGIYGVEAASRRFFGKGAHQLTPAEAALLAAVLPSPRRYRADQPGPYVKRRQGEILRQMDLLGRSWLADVLPP